MEVYFTSTLTDKKQIEKIQNEALRLCTGAMRSRPVCCLQHVCNETPSYTRTQQTILSTLQSASPFQKHPAHSLIQNSWYDFFPNRANYYTFNMLSNVFFSSNLEVHKLASPCNPLWLKPPF